MEPTPRMNTDAASRTRLSKRVSPQTVAAALYGLRAEVSISEKGES